MALRSRGIPFDKEYRCVAVLPAASIILSTMCLGVAPSGFPMPKSIMSSPRARAEAFSSPVMLNTYGGRRFNRKNSCIGFVPKSLLNTLISIPSLDKCLPNGGDVRCSARFERDVDHRVAQIDAVISTIMQRLHDIR